MPKFNIYMEIHVVREFASQEEAEKWAELNSQSIEMELDDFRAELNQCLVMNVIEFKPND